MPVKANDREYRMMMPLTVAEENKQLDSDFYVEGIATTFDKPYLLYSYDGIDYFEVISSKAFEGADLSDVIFQFDHEGRVLARQSNNTLLVKPRTGDLFIAGDLSRSNAAQDIYSDIKAGLVTKMSWAFSVDAESYDKTTRTRTIEKVKKVYDVSAVSLPANDATTISARSFAEGRHSADMEEFQRRKRLQLLIKLEETLHET